MPRIAQDGTTRVAQSGGIRILSQEFYVPFKPVKDDDMPVFKVKRGTTGYITPPFTIYDTSSSVGAGLSGLAYNSAGLVCAYMGQNQSAATAITLANVATPGTWVSGGFVVADASLMPTQYQLHVPNAVIALGNNQVKIVLSGAANMATVEILLSLIAYDEQDAAALGLSGVATAATQSTAAATSSAAAVTAIGNLPSASSIAATILGTVVDGSINVKQVLALLLSEFGGTWSASSINPSTHRQTINYCRQDGSTVLKVATIQYASDNVTPTGVTVALGNLP